MNNITAAIALEQLKKLPAYMKRRAEIHQYYNEHLKPFSWIELPPVLPDYVETSYYFYHIQIKNGKRDEFARFLRENGIYTNPLMISMKYLYKIFEFKLLGG